MPYEDLVREFKRAFKANTKAENANIRWGEAKKFWQKETSMKVIASALDHLETHRSPEGVKHVRDAIAALPPKKREKYEDSLKTLERELDGLVLERARVVSGKVRRVRTGDGRFSIRDGDDEVLSGDLDENKARYMGGVLSKLDTALTGTDVELDDVDKLLASIKMDDKLGKESGAVDGTVWSEAITHLKDKVLPGVSRDLPKMVASGLVPEGATLAGVAFTGSDFHKGGKQVLILRMKLPDGKEKKVVYKPSSLMVDALLFGKEGVASKVDGVSTYNVVPSVDESGKDQGFGYMEFVDKEGGPSSAKDVLGIYESIAGAMAMSYYVGLDDVHQDNLIVKKGSVQVIDMEATTGIFKPGKVPQVGGFNDQLWNKGIYQGVGETLKGLADEGKLRELPKDDEVEQKMEEKFRAVLDRLGGGEADEDLETLEKALAKQRTRIVPIATNAFQKTLIPEAQKYDFPGWKKRLADDLVGIADVDEEEYGKHDSNMLVVGKGQTSSSLEVIKRLLQTRGVYDAMIRGDVPYYVRELGSKNVYDEKDERIDASGHPKVGEPIHLAMKQRREADIEPIVAIFKAQGVKHVLSVQEQTRQRLKTD